MGCGWVGIGVVGGVVKFLLIGMFKFLMDFVLVFILFLGLFSCLFWIMVCLDGIFVWILGFKVWGFMEDGFVFVGIISEFFVLCFSWLRCLWWMLFLLLRIL